MLTFEQMVIRLLIAAALGAIVGWEREAIGKDAGIRTTILVASGACIFTMMALALPYVVAAGAGFNSASLEDILAHNSGFLGLAANIVTGIGFLGAGIIIKDKDNEHVRGLTTAAVVWATAAVGTTIGIGLIDFGVFSALLLTLLLYTLRKIKLYEHIRPGHRADRRDGE